MKISVISFTQAGKQISKKIFEKLCGAGSMEIQLYTKHRKRPGEEQRKKEQAVFIESPVGEWAKEQMQKKNAMLFIGACGIAVRAVAPYLTDKLHDVPVIVMDEKGRYVIPILSGHVGGANKLAVFLAQELGAEPVITTATDLEEKFAVDLFAKRNGLFIVNKEGIAKVSAKVLAGENITVSIENGHEENSTPIPEEVCMIGYPPKEAVDVIVTSKKGWFDATLTLRPKEYVIGVGCKKGKTVRELDSFISGRLKEVGIQTEQVVALASISLKREEQGIQAWCRKENIPFLTYTAQELKETAGQFASSYFVEEQTGVDNVCERAAIKGCGACGRLVAGKYAKGGMTVAVAKREWRVSFYTE